MEALLSTGPTPSSFQLSRPPNLSRLYQADTRPLPQNIKCLMLIGSSKAKENFDADFIMVFNRQGTLSSAGGLVEKNSQYIGAIHAHLKSKL